MQICAFLGSEVVLVTYPMRGKIAAGFSPIYRLITVLGVGYHTTYYIVCVQTGLVYPYEI